MTLQNAPLQIATIPCLTDNYAFLMHDGPANRTVLIDAPEAGPILTALTDRGWSLDEIWLTHHHDDHIQGVRALRDAYPGVVVTGAAADAHRLPPLDRAVAPGDTLNFAGHDVQVIDVSGHTIGHIALHVPDAHALFSADSLMALGCGRLFEGDGPMMWASMQRLLALPDDTMVYSGHEYTASNAAFACSVDPDNAALRDRAAGVEAARAAGQPTVPSTLAEEKATNPFLRPHLPGIRAHLDMGSDDDAAVFTEIRSRKDKF